jgi:hypothetical protein
LVPEDGQVAQFLLTDCGSAGYARGHASQSIAPGTAGVPKAASLPDPHRTWCSFDFAFRERLDEGSGGIEQDECYACCSFKD